MCGIRQREVLHNEIERLCDCAQVRALGESELDRLFADLRLGSRAAMKKH